MPKWFCKMLGRFRDEDFTSCCVSSCYPAPISELYLVCRFTIVALAPVAADDA